MKYNRFFAFSGIALITALLFSPPIAALAQSGQTSIPAAQALMIFTQYPSRIIGFGETASLPLTIQAGSPQTVSLAVENLPQGWTASFQGASQIVDEVYVDGKIPSTVDLQVDPPATAQAGKYDMTIVASGPQEKAQFPISLTIKEKLPPRLSLAVDGLPTKRGAPNTATTFGVTLKNEGDEDLVTTLSATQPDNLEVKVESGGQEVTEVKLAANDTQSLTIVATPLTRLNAGQYPFTVQASAGNVNAQLPLTLEVVGEGSLSVSGPDGQLSGDAVAGKQNPLKIALENTGTDSLRGIQLTSSAPSGWSVTFDQSQVAEIPAGQTVDVNAQIKPPDNAIAGDYQVTISAQPLDSPTQSTDFRITVQTPTVWGVAGIGLIALAVAVVGMAVARFGRR